MITGQKHTPFSRDAEGERVPMRSGPLAALRRFTASQPAVSRCDLCSLQLADEHAHLIVKSGTYRCSARMAGSELP